jgi:16S rRNA (guanine527-N7)-methyltransferase
MDIINKYFRSLTDAQNQQFLQLSSLYEKWNAKINVISRKDISKLYTNHILHSLAIAKVIQFKEGTKVLDLGTGGGFPGIPLAIFFPETDFILLDSIGKKIKVVNEISNALGLENVQTLNDRAENLEEKFDFIVSRAVANISEFRKWVHGRFNKKNKNMMDNGIIYLKGGDITAEFQGISCREYNISDFFEESYFKTKKVVYIKSS